MNKLNLQYFINQFTYKKITNKMKKKKMYMVSFHSWIDLKQMKTFCAVFVTNIYN